MVGHTVVASAGELAASQGLPGLLLSQFCEGLVDDLLQAGVELPSIYLLIGGRLRCQAARGYFQVVDGFPPRTGVIGAAVDGPCEVVVPDVRDDPSFIAAIPHLRAEACVPVLVHGVAVGAVNAESTRALPASWLPALRAAATTLADHIAGIGGLPVPSPIQRLARVAVQLGALEDASAVEALTVAAATEVSPMRSAMLARTIDGTLSCATAAGPLARELSSFDSQDLDLMASWVLAGTSSHVPDGHDMPAPYAFVARAGIRSLSVHPMTAGGRSTGLLIVADTEPHRFDSAVVEALELLAAQAATSIATLEAMDTLRRRAAQDPLTGCGNFGAFIADLRSGIARQPRGAHLACLIIDIDGFKRINDERGHPAGDELLRGIAAALGEALRGTDRLFRIGGDEFAVTAYLEDEAVTAGFAHRLVEVARHGDATVSVGAAWAAEHDDATTLRDRADRALYDAKRAGRNTARLR